MPENNGTEEAKSGIRNPTNARILYSTKMSFKNEGELNFSKQKLNEFITSRPASQEM